MYKCVDCGNLFDDGEFAIVVDRHPYGMTYAEERSLVCPVCGGDFEETESCKICGGEFLDDELYDGSFCHDCLMDSVTVDSIREFSRSENLPIDEITIVEDCVFKKILKIIPPEKSSKELKALCDELYSEQANVGLLREYIAESDFMFEFAEFLNERS